MKVRRLSLVTPFFGRLVLGGLLGLSALGLGACGGSPEKHDQPIIQEPEHPVGKPATYYLDDFDCQNTKQTFDLTATTIPFWQGLNISTQLTPLHDIRSNASLFSPAIKATYFHRDWRRDCGNWQTPPGRACVTDNGQPRPWDKESDDFPLKVCKNNYNYPQDTYEGVALTSIHYIENAYDKYVAATQAALPPIDLDVLPNFESRFDHYADGKVHDVVRVEYITHNLAYFPANKMIVVFPERASSNNTVSNGLWESSFVLAHEFGHHIEDALFGSTLNSQGLQWDPIHEGYHSVKPPIAKGRALGNAEALADGGSSSSFTYQNPKVWGAFSEAFADLNAYYTNDANAESLIGLRCFGYNRTIPFNVFKDGTRKVLTQDVENQLLGTPLGSLSGIDGPTSENVVLACERPDFSDIHNVGAILTHAVDRVITDTVQASSIDPMSADGIMARYRLNIAWLKYSHKEKQALTDRAAPANSVDPFQPLAVALRDAVDEFAAATPPLDQTHLDALKKAVCNDLKEDLPVVAPPYAEADGSCAPR